MADQVGAFARRAIAGAGTNPLVEALPY
jgi:hypothetical protein